MNKTQQLYCKTHFEELKIKYKEYIENLKLKKCTEEIFESEIEPDMDPPNCYVCGIMYENY